MVYILNRYPNKVFCSITLKEMCNMRRLCIAYMCVFKSLVNAMVPDEKRDELDAKGIKCMFLGYCECMKVYRLMCMETKKIIENKDIMFKEDSGSIRNDLEMRPCGRNEDPIVVVVDKSSKLPLFDGDGQFVDDNEQGGGRN